MISLEAEQLHRILAPAKASFVLTGIGTQRSSQISTAILAPVVRSSTRISLETITALSKSVTVAFLGSSLPLENHLVS